MPVNVDSLPLTISFTVRSNGEPAFSLRSSDNSRPPGANAEQGPMYNVDFRVTEKTPEIATAFVLLPNTPNPFIEITLVKFLLPQASRAVLRIFDAYDALVFETEDNFLAGEGNFLLRREDIGQAGVYAYQVETDFGVASRKFIMF